MYNLLCAIKMTTSTGEKRKRSDDSQLIRNDGDFYTAVREWRADKDVAESKYGHISLWDVSNVTKI